MRRWSRGRRLAGAREAWAAEALMEGIGYRLVPQERAVLEPYLG